MDVAEVRQVFNLLIERVTDPDRIAKLELCREYFTNPEFRQYLEQTVYNINSRG